MKQNRGLKSTTGDAINQAVREYLLKNGCAATLDMFSKEMANSKTENSKSVSGIIKFLEAGQKDRFFAQWNKLIQPNVQQTIECQKLEFYIRVFFAIYPMHPIVKGGKHVDDSDMEEYKTTMEDFKGYINSKGAVLAKSEECLPFYALPYIPNPMDHPTFKVFFTRNWLNDLRESIQKFILSKISKGGPLLIEQMYRAYNDKKRGVVQQSPQKGGRQAGQRKLPPPGPRQEEIELQDRLQKLTEEYETLQADYDTLQEKEDYTRATLIESQTKWNNFAREIVNVAKELYNTVQLVVNGSHINQDVLEGLRDKIYRYENFLQISESDEMSGNMSFSVSNIDQSVPTISPIPPPFSPQQPFTAASDDHSMAGKMTRGNGPYPPLNYSQLIKDLDALQDESRMCSILQALRWRLTRSMSIVRRDVINTYVKFNILQTIGPHDSLLEKLLASSYKVQEFTVRFVNVIASECQGRTYLLNKQNIVQTLVDQLYSDQADTVLRQNALGCLQKLSLRRQPQSTMIELDMIDWLENILKNEIENTSFYTLEYATALLMNLSLRTAGKDKIETSNELLPTLNNLLEHENLQVRTYVNGTLYSILTRARLKEQALRLGMDDALRYLMDHSEGDFFKRQIQYILEQLNADEEDECLSDENEDDVENREEDESELIAEDEDMDDLLEIPGLETGEEILLNNYAHQEEKSVNMAEAAKPMIRPETPKDRATLASELKSRPKIPRTPAASAGPTGKIPHLNQPVVSAGAMSDKDSTAASKRLTTPQQEEFETAFLSRSKIPRSPK